MTNDLLGAKATLTTPAGTASYVSLATLAATTGAQVARLPHTVKILLENIARRVGSRDVSEADVVSLARWPDGADASIAFMPARVLMQDFTGVPAVVDLAAMRGAVARAGGDPKRVNPFIPVDLIIDHSVQVDRFGSDDAYAANLKWEYLRNRERYALLNWAQQAFDGFRVVPPGMGICHQVNLEHLGRVVLSRGGWVFPDTLVGTDSHTPMINGLGVLGWGVGGIEAEAAMLGQPMFLQKPVVVGVRTRGTLPPGTTATDLVLTLTQMLRAHGVVGKFVEFFGAGLSALSVADRATLANMSPEFGATSTLFPVDANTLQYLRLTGRGGIVNLVERYTREQGLFRTDEDPEPIFNEMIAAGLLARKAVQAGLQCQPWVKTSLAPGSRVVTRYLDNAGLTPYLEKLGFYLVGYGCTTCIGNSGPLPAEIADVVTSKDLAVVAVLSGNRNFEGRIHGQVKASYLASPPLCVAYALKGTVLCDLTTDPLGTDRDGKAVYLKDLWPTAEEVDSLVASCVSSNQFDVEYGRIFAGNEQWQSMPAPTGTLFDWDSASTYVREPPYFLDVAHVPTPPADISGARALALLGDSITTDHISPAGTITADSPAGKFLVGHAVPSADFNSFGSRRGNHEVMMRGTFGNIRLRNLMTPGVEGPSTVHVPSGEKMSIYDAALRYQREATPLVVIAGKEYGSGSSRDWAAKGSALLGIKAVIAQSYERIHRSNLVCMGVLPLQFETGISAQSLGLTGFEAFSIAGIGAGITPRQTATVIVTRQDGSQVEFATTVRIDAPAEVDYFLHGGILQMVLRQLLPT